MALRLFALVAAFTTTFLSTSDAEEGWISARAPIAHGYTEVQIAAVKSGKVPLTGITGDLTQSEEDHLYVLLVILNKSDSKKLNHVGFSGSVASSFDHSGPKLKDDLGNTYRQINFGFGNKVPMQAKSESIYPEKSCTDMVVFETPIDKAKTLYLELAGSSLGEKENYRFQIPKEMINEELEKPKEPESKKPPGSKKKPDRKPDRKPDVRTWTSSDGKKVQAEFQGASFVGDGGKVRLKKMDGTTVTVPLEKLSEADQEFVRNRSKGK